MDLSAPLPAEFENRRKALMAVADDGKAPPMDKDSMLMAPMSEWERSDREGTCGNGRRVFSSPSEAFRRGWEAIDWRK